MESQLSMQTNYTIYKVDERILDLIMREVGSFVGRYVYKDGLFSYEYQKNNIIETLKRYNGKYKEYVKIWKGHNLVPLVMREAMASILIGSTVTPTFEVQYMALGDDNTTPTNSDTTLGNETLRGLFTNKFSVDNVAYFDKFFSSAEVGGNTYLEAGMFVDGSASADTGYLISRVLIDEAISVTETLTFNCTITIS